MDFLIEAEQTLDGILEQLKWSKEEIMNTQNPDNMPKDQANFQADEHYSISPIKCPAAVHFKLHYIDLENFQPSWDVESKEDEEIVHVLFPQFLKGKESQHLHEIANRIRERRTSNAEKKYSQINPHRVKKRSRTLETEVLSSNKGTKYRKSIGKATPIEFNREIIRLSMEELEYER